MKALNRIKRSSNFCIGIAVVYSLVFGVISFWIQLLSGLIVGTIILTLSYPGIVLLLGLSFREICTVLEGKRHSRENQLKHLAKELSEINMLLKK